MTLNPDKSRIADIIRSGIMRIGVFPSFFYTKGDDGDLEGFGIEFARLLSVSLGLELVIREYLAPPVVVNALKSAECDLAFFGLDPKRAADVDFSPPYLKADFTFLVPGASTAVDIADVDGTGQRVAVVRDHAMDFALRGKLVNAEFVYASTPDESFDLLRTGRADVLAGIRPGLLEYAEALDRSRVLAGRYGENTLALAVAKGQPAWLAYVSDFVLKTRTSGLLENTIKTTGLAGVEPILR